MNEKYTPEDYSDDDLLYRGFRKDNLNEIGEIDMESINLKDLSCNWDRFSEPNEILNIRTTMTPFTGCFSFTVKTSRFKNMATPCHAPKQDNFSHTEVRLLKKDENVFYEPESGRPYKKIRSKTERREYRMNLHYNHNIEIYPE